MKAIFAAALSCAAVTLAAGQQPTFSTRLDVVRVDVLVTDGGRVVRGLGPADFEIVDNGVVQQADLASFEELPLNVVLAFDMSRSVSGERLGHLREAGNAAIGALERDDRAGLVTFSHKLTLRQGLTGDIHSIRNALLEAEPRGDTALVDGTYAALLVGEADAGRDLLIVFSDGLDTASWLPAATVIETARRLDVTVYAVVAKEHGKSDFLGQLAEATGGNVVEIESTRDLSRTFLGILEEFRQRYLVSYTPRGVAKDGWHKLQVRLKGRRATIRARAGYFGG